MAVQLTKLSRYHVIFHFRHHLTHAHVLCRTVPRPTSRGAAWTVNTTTTSIKLHRAWWKREARLLERTWWSYDQSGPVRSSRAQTHSKDFVFTYFKG